MATCASYGAIIQFYLDDELSGSDRQKLESHLSNCSDCRQELDELRALSRQIRQTRPKMSAPASLHERIRELAAHQEQERKEAPGKAQTMAFRPYKPAGKRSFPKLVRLPVAIAAMLCLFAGVSLSISHLRREAAAESFIDTAILAHRGLTDASMPLDIRSDSSKTVTTWFNQKVPFPFRMPNSGIASDDTAKYVLTGGRLLPFAGERAAMLAFRTPDDTVSVLISSGNKAIANGGKITHSDGITFHSRDRDDLHVVTWENMNLVYALVTSNKTSGSHTCSSCHEGAKPAQSAALKTSGWINQ
jgi:anti-sigma factor RsiW